MDVLHVIMACPIISAPLLIFTDKLKVQQGPNPWNIWLVRARAETSEKYIRQWGKCYHVWIF